MIGLDTIQDNETFVFGSVPENSVMMCLGIREGGIAKRIYKCPFGGSYVLEIGTRRIAIDYDLAKDINIRRSTL